MSDDDILTVAREKRIALATNIAAACPAELGAEIAITGSVARDVADTYSDIELNFWTERYPPEDRIRSWLDELGAQKVAGEYGEADVAGFRWLVCRIEGIWVELGWCPIPQFDEFVRDLAAGVFVSHERLQFGWTIDKTIVLRTDGSVPAWRSKLSVYPVGLAERVIADQTAVWAKPHVPGVRWGLAQRNQRMGLALRFTWDMQNLLRVLFATNHLWDHDLKWTDPASLRDLTIKPDRLSERIDAMFTLADLRTCVEANQRLIIDTLELVAEQGFDVDGALASMRNGLTEGLAETSPCSRAHIPG